MKVDRNHDEQEPLFSSLDEMCAAWGFSDAVKEQMRRDMLLTAPRDVDSEALH
jgi:hypothetical protein